MVEHFDMHEHRVEIISPELLSTSMGRLPSLSGSSGLGTTTSSSESFFEDHGDGTLAITTGGFLDSSEKDFNSWLDRREGLVQFYDIFFGINWQDELIKYLRKVSNRINNNDWEILFRLQREYIEDLVRWKWPNPKLLQPQTNEYKYHCEEHFPWREQIMHSEVLYHIGNKFLDFESSASIERKMIWEIFYNRMCESGQFSNIFNKWKLKFEDAKKIPWRKIFDQAWDLTTGLHEVGRFPENVDLIQTNMLPSANDFLQDFSKVKNYLYQEVKRSGNEAGWKVLGEQNHGVVNCMALFLFYKQLQKLKTDLNSDLVIHLTQKAMYGEIEYISDIDHSTYSGINSPEEWKKNPLGAFFATVLLLAESPARICWHGSCDEQGNIETFVPVRNLNFIRKDSEARFVFGIDFSQIPDGVIPHKEPISEYRLKALKEALGLDCMGLLSREQAEKLETEWDPPYEKWPDKFTKVPSKKGGKRIAPIEKPLTMKTVLELDLVNYTEIARYLEDILNAGAVEKLNQQIQNFVRQGLNTVGGASYEKNVMTETGDGAILVFDKAEDAYRFAEVVHEATRKHNTDKTEPLARMFFRIGASTGEISMIARKSGGYDIAGVTIAIAVRLEAAARPGEFFIDLATYKALPDTLQNIFENEELVPGKRKEKFRARRCVMNAEVPKPTEPIPVPTARDASGDRRKILKIFSQLDPGQIDLLIFLLEIPIDHQPPITLTLADRKNQILRIMEKIPKGLEKLESELCYLTEKQTQNISDVFEHREIMSAKKDIERTPENKKPIVTKNFLIHLLKGGVKSIPFFGGLIEEMIFGTLEGDAAEREAAKLEKALDLVYKSLEEQKKDMSKVLDFEIKKANLAKELIEQTDELLEIGSKEITEISPKLEGILEHFLKRMNLGLQDVSKDPEMILNQTVQDFLIFSLPKLTSGDLGLLITSLNAHEEVPPDAINKVKVAKLIEWAKNPTGPGIGTVFEKAVNMFPALRKLFSIWIRKPTK